MLRAREIPKNLNAIVLTGLWLISLGLTGCATTPPSTTTTQTPEQQVTWGSRVQALSNIESWDLDALIAIRNNKDAGSANMQWQQSRQNYSILLYGPMGSNSTKLIGRPGQVTLEFANGKRATAATPEQLLRAQTGWRLPVSNLYYWIRGLPVPSMAAQKQFDNANHIIQLTQEGWLVQYLDYTTVNHIDMPRKIFLNNPEMTVKIVINQWKF